MTVKPTINVPELHSHFVSVDQTPSHPERFLTRVFSMHLNIPERNSGYSPLTAMKVRNVLIIKFLGKGGYNKKRNSRQLVPSAFIIEVPERILNGRSPHPGLPECGMRQSGLPCCVVLLNYYTLPFKERFWAVNPVSYCMGGTSLLYFTTFISINTIIFDFKMGYTQY